MLLYRTDRLLIGLNVILSLGAGELQVRGTSNTARVLLVHHIREGHGTVVEEGHLQSDRSHGRHNSGILQVAQLDAAAS